MLDGEIPVYPGAASAEPEKYDKHGRNQNAGYRHADLDNPCLSTDGDDGIRGGSEFDLAKVGQCVAKRRSIVIPVLRLFLERGIENGMEPIGEFNIVFG